MKIIIRIAPPKISLYRSFLKPSLSKSLNDPSRLLKYSFKISKMIEKITVKIPLRTKKAKGENEIVQINSLKPRATVAETRKIPRLVLKPKSSPASRLVSSPFQNNKNAMALNVKSPKKNPIAWVKIISQTILLATNIISGAVIEKILGVKNFFKILLLLNFYSFSTGIISRVLISPLCQTFIFTLSPTEKRFILEIKGWSRSIL